VPADPVMAELLRRASPDRGVPRCAHGAPGCSAWAVSGPGGAILIESHDYKDPLFLQAKEAHASVLGRFAGNSEDANQG
jgi:hypothetical protein